MSKIDRDLNFEIFNQTLIISIIYWIEDNNDDKTNKNNGYINCGNTEIKWQENGNNNNVKENRPDIESTLININFGRRMKENHWNDWNDNNN